jgi:hypothetical protein
LTHLLVFPDFGTTTIDHDRILFGRHSRFTRMNGCGLQANADRKYTRELEIRC